MWVCKYTLFYIMIHMSDSMGQSMHNQLHKFSVSNTIYFREILNYVHTLNTSAQGWWNLLPPPVPDLSHSTPPHSPLIAITASDDSGHFPRGNIKEKIDASGDVCTVQIFGYGRYGRYGRYGSLGAAAWKQEPESSNVGGEPPGEGA